MEINNETSLLDLEVRSMELAQTTVEKLEGQEHYNNAVKNIAELAQFVKDAEARFKIDIEPAHQEHLRLTGQRNSVINPVQNLIQQIKSAIVSFDHEQQRIRREEQAQIERERRELEESERVKLAEQLKSQGVGEDEAIEIASTSPVSVPVRTAPTYEKASGISLRHNYKAEVTDFKKLVQFVAKNPMYLNLLQPNESNINSQARALKEQLTIPGLCVYDDVGASVRR